MDHDPKTRAEKKGNKLKRNRELNAYNSKHIRISEQNKSNSCDKNKDKGNNNTKKK